MESVPNSPDVPVDRKPLAGLGWGALCGAAGGVVSGIALTALMVVFGPFFVETEKGLIDLVRDIASYYLTVGLIFGTFFGVLAGSFVGLVIGTNRHESIAPQTGAVVATFGPLALASVVLFHPQGESVGIMAAIGFLVWSATMAAIGYGTGMVFRRLLTR